MLALAGGAARERVALKALALVLLLALSLALPAIVLAAPLGPLGVPHVSQFGPTADGHDGTQINDCSCAVAVMFLRTYVGDNATTVNQCCSEVGCPTSVWYGIQPWLNTRGVPLTWRWATPEYERDLIRAGHPFATYIYIGGIYHTIMVVGFDDDNGKVYIHNPSSQTGPDAWEKSNYDLLRWKNPEPGSNHGLSFVVFTMSELPGWNRETGRVDK